MDSPLLAQLYERSRQSKGLPDKELSSAFIESIYHFLFLPEKATQASKEDISGQYEGIRAAFAALVHDVLPVAAAVTEHAAAFFDALPGIYNQLLGDAAAILQFDPAATSQEEIFIAYPGFFATAVYRMAHQLYQQDIPALPRLLSAYAHSKTGIDIHPAAVIGHSFFIDHGTGIVIGGTTRIGNHVKIYQGVTLGAQVVAKALATSKRHPTVEDHVIIYSGATILGGETVIGHDSIIGGNVWLTRSVAPYALVYQKNEVVIRDQTLAEPLNFII